jgi:hypothetical protein
MSSFILDEDYDDAAGKGSRRIALAYSQADRCMRRSAGQ